MAHRYLAMFRAVLAETLLLQTLYTPEALDRRWAWALLAVYVAMAGVFWWLGVKGRLSQRANLFSFLGDIVLTELIIYSTGLFTSDFYLVCFLIILASCLLEDIRFSFIVGGISCIIYGAVAFPQGESFQPAYLLRLSVLLAMSFFSTYAIDRARTLQQATADLYEAKMASMQRLSLVGQALAEVLHEVRTPLGTIALSAEYARKVLDHKPQEAVERMKVIEAEAQRAADIINEYLDFMRPSELTLTPLDPIEPLRRTLEILKIRLDERGIKVVTDPLPQTLIEGSRRHLIQVYTIVLMNAIEAMPLGGCLTICGEVKDRHLMLRFKDTGTGITHENQGRLFQTFATSRDDGMGLGLTIARWIIDKHRGSITLTSSGALKGAEVVLSLPVKS